MIKETVSCDLCGRTIAQIENEHAAKPFLDELCVVCTVLCRASDVAVVQSKRAHVVDGRVEQTAHVCYECANEALVFGPLERFGKGLGVPEPRKSSNGEHGVSEQADEVQDDAEEVASQVALLPKEAGRMAATLDVVVAGADGAISNVSGVEGARFHLLCSGGSKVAARAMVHRLIRFPVGATVSFAARPLLCQGRFRVVGYAVREKFDSWEVVSPRCGICNNVTERGARVIVPYEGPRAFEAICTGCASGVADDCERVPGTDCAAVLQQLSSVPQQPKSL